MPIRRPHPYRDRLGARLQPPDRTRCTFTVWAPHADRVEAVLLGDDNRGSGSGSERLVPLAPAEHGYYVGEADGVPAGTRYLYQLNGNPKHRRPDPASRLQPEGVHGPSAVVDEHAHSWRDAGWHGRPLADYVIYEVHLGTFTAAGTCDAAIPHLARLRDLGITAVELMPVAHFPGRRNWGYDGVNPFAVHTAYGGPDALKRFVDACHQHGLGAILDVVYNHLGPEGNYLRDYGPYFTEVYRTPWGDAVNVDHAHSDEVRAYFLANAVQWLREFHFDALRLDAVHAIFDNAAYPFLEELADTVRAEVGEQRPFPAYLIAESDLNDDKLVREPASGGYGLHGMWQDDLHHALHARLTGERDGYYADYGGTAELARAWTRGLAYAGEYSAFRKRRHGRLHPDEPLRPSSLVVAAQTHDQVGNRMLGERLATLVPWEALKLAAAVVQLSPYVPLLFMGEEYAEDRPFLYFIDHGDPRLVQAVREGRKREFAAFAWHGEPLDPASEATFRRSMLQHPSTPRHETMQRLTRALLTLRRTLRRDDTAAEARETPTPGVLLAKRHLAAAPGTPADSGETRTWQVWNTTADAVEAPLALPRGRWRVHLATSDPEWDGPGPVLAGRRLDVARDNDESAAPAPALPLPGYAVVVLVPDNA